MNSVTESQRVQKNHNQLTLRDLSDLSADDVAAVSVDQLELLQAELAEVVQETKGHASKLSAGLAVRYAEKAAASRKSSGKDTGTVTLTDGDFKVAADLPKKVTYHQGK